MRSTHSFQAPLVISDMLRRNMHRAIHVHGKVLHAVGASMVRCCSFIITFAHAMIVKLNLY